MARRGALSPATHLELAHAGPALAVITVGLAFGVAASRGDPQVGRLLLLGGLLAGNQYAAGALNDAVDADEDARAGRRKPIETGRIGRRTVLLLALAAGAVSLACGAALGLEAFLLAALGLACAFAYDLGVKRTRFSVLPFAVALPLIPLFGYAAAGRIPPVLWWALPIGAFAALAIHLADALPDVETDRAGGSRGLAASLGVGRAAAVAAVAYGGAVTCATATAVAYGRPVWGWLGGGVAAVAGAAAVAVGRGGPGARRRAYRLVLIGTAALAAGWAVAVRP